MGREVMRIKIIKAPIGDSLNTKTTVFKIVNLDGSEIDSLDAVDTFYIRKKSAIKYINNSKEFELMERA